MMVNFDMQMIEIIINREFIKFKYRQGMITTKLRKECSPKCLLVEFSNAVLPQPFGQFLKTCREEGIHVRRDNLKSNQLNFYCIQSEKSVDVKGIKLENVPENINFLLSILYVNSEALEKEIIANVPNKRTMLLRQGLDTQFFIDYEVEDTQSQFESTIFLCELSATIINSQVQKDIGFYDQKTEEIKGSTAENQKERLWRNIFYQIPGLGKQKCLAITQKYPSYESLLLDFQTTKQLKNVQVSKGTKQMKLGSTLANRIYRCLFLQDGLQSIYEE